MNLLMSCFGDDTKTGPKLSISLTLVDFTKTCIEICMKNYIIIINICVYLDRHLLEIDIL